MTDESTGPATEELLADVIAESDGQAEGDKPETEAEGTDEAEGDKSEDAGDKEDDAGDKENAEGDKDEDEDDEQPKKKKLSGSERLKRRLAAAEAELNTLRSRGSRDGEITAADIVREIGRPPSKAEYGDDFAGFERAMMAYELDARQAVRELRKQSTQAQNARAAVMREAVEEHQERCTEFAAKVPDFSKALRDAAHLKASPTIEALVLESDKSAHLVYHLAKNPDRLEKLNRMSEREAAREIGRIEARLSQPKPKTETKAPKPVKPPKGAAAPSSPERELDAWLKRKYG